MFNNSERKYFLVHRLVAISFIPNPENKPEVNHKWGIKDDNRVAELEWATKSENEIHSVNVLGRKGIRGDKSNLCKLSFKQVCEIRQKYKWRVNTHKMLAKEYGVSSCTVAFIVNNKYRVYE